ncbi:hypothetical protein CL618_03710 [archaeon]|nr:hypothetical protein [archaeon]|tara:strand:- start:445 stop:840 length:396 start_codon:yes stop_codon:yes gene_type:complete
MKVIFGGKDPVNRKAVENKTVDILMHPEKGRNKDFMKSRNSGLNQVLCKLANKNNVAIGFDFNHLLRAKESQRPNILGRMKFNVKLCNKYNVKMYVCNSKKNKTEIRSDHDLEAFGRVLGMRKAKIKKFEY